MSILIKDTTREERERIVAESLGNINGSCDGCMSGHAEMYQDYIDGKKELREINVDPENPHCASKDGILYSKDMTILYVCPAAHEGKVVIPDTVTKIGNQRTHLYRETPR